jgi:RNA polymerase sigma-70 factor (ECF subfamily)
VVVAPAAGASDEDLATLAATGDTAAFETLVSRYQGRMYRLACRLTGSEADAPDVLQEAFLAAYRGLGSFRGTSRFSTWLYRVATNAALMHRRRQTRRKTEPLDDYLPRFGERGEHAAEPAELRLASHADEILDRKRLAERAHEALARLPEIYRDAFVLRDLEELPTDEVAELLGIESAAVRQRVHRARLMLRGYLVSLAGGAS